MTYGIPEPANTRTRHLAASPFRMPDQLETGILSFLGSELLVVRGDNRTSVLDPSTGHERLLAVDTCDDHSSPQGFSIISSDGRYLLTSCRSRGHLGDVSLWAVDGGVKLAEHGFSAYSGVAYNSTVLHELYFDGIGEAPTQPSGLLAQAISRDFGSFDRWRAEFAATGKALAGGSGWVVLAHSPRDKRLFIHWAADHSMAPAGCVPLLALDMYEHAYAIDYGADAAKYVDVFMQAIKWTNAERLYREAMRV